MGLVGMGDCVELGPGWDGGTVCGQKEAWQCGRDCVGKVP